MKRNLLIALCIVMGLASCGKKDSFNVNINLKNANDNTLIYLRKIVDNKTVVVDSATFQKELATLTAPKDDEQLLYSIKVKGLRGSMEFFPENQDITVVGDLENATDVEILGGAAQTLYNQYNEGLRSFNEQMRGLYSEMEAAYNAGDTAKMEDLNNQGNAIMEQQRNYTKNFIRDHGDHFLGHYILASIKQDYTLDELREAMGDLKNESVYTKDLNDYVAKQERIAVGQPCIDFTLQTAEGTDVVLSEYIKGSKLTLVDFWASWCGPCRGENPHVVAAYEKYHDKGFNVLGVSVDQDVQAWQRAVNDDKLTWTQVRDAQNGASEAYLVYYIPSNFLIDENGIIVDKNLRGEKLEEALASRL